MVRFVTVIVTNASIDKPGESARASSRLPKITLSRNGGICFRWENPNQTTATQTIQHTVIVVNRMLHLGFIVLQLC